MIENIASNSQVTNFTDSVTTTITVFGGYFASIGLNVKPLLISNSIFGICAIVAIETCLVLFVGVLVVKYRYALMYAHRRVWNWAYDMVTFDEVKEYRDVTSSDLQLGYGRLILLFQNTCAILRYNRYNEDMKEEVATV